MPERARRARAANFMVAFWWRWVFLCVWWEGRWDLGMVLLDLLLAAAAASLGVYIMACLGGIWSLLANIVGGPTRSFASPCEDEFVGLVVLAELGSSKW